MLIGGENTALFLLQDLGNDPALSLYLPVTGFCFVSLRFFSNRYDLVIFPVISLGFCDLSWGFVNLVPSF